VKLSLVPLSRRLHTPQAGFSLIELIVVMLLMMVVMGAIYGIWFGLQRTYSYTEDDMRAQREAQAALAEMVELIRTARQPNPAPSDALNVVIYSADDNSLICWTDVDRDAAHTLELVKFWVDTDTRTLYRDTDVNHTNDPTFATASAVRLVGNWLSNDASLPLFSYYGADGAPLETTGATHEVVDPTQIREVRIDLRIDLYENNRPIAHELRSVVQPRNLRQY
jgi:prepilin-type N-terminal cleavage/methylation domain-containing protein